MPTNPNRLHHGVSQLHADFPHKLQKCNSKCIWRGGESCCTSNLINVTYINKQPFSIFKTHFNKTRFIHKCDNFFPT